MSTLNPHLFIFAQNVAIAGLAYLGPYTLSTSTTVSASCADMMYKLSPQKRMAHITQSVKVFFRGGKSFSKIPISGVGGSRTRVQLFSLLPIGACISRLCMWAFSLILRRASPVDTPSQPHMQAIIAHGADLSSYSSDSSSVAETSPLRLALMSVTIGELPPSP